MSKSGRDSALGLGPTLPGQTAGGAEPLYGNDFGSGAVVGDWVVEELRSRGGFATVYRARHAASARPAALKVLHAHLAASANMIRRFRQEGETIRRIRHPNIVDLLEFGELSDGRPWFVMEWLEGHNLEEELRARGPLSVDEALAVMEDLCAALVAAHDVGVVHRDLKASNVVVIPAGEWFVVKLVDFGIAKLLDDERPRSEGLTSTGARMGTPHNMAPEQILGHAVDVRTDVYALGILLYQLVTGQLPFRAETAIEIEEQHLYAPPPRASDLAPVSAAFDAVIARCLEKDRAARYATVSEVLGDVRRAVAGVGPHAPSWAAELRPSGRFRAKAVPAIGVHFEVRVQAEDEEVDDGTLDDVERVIAAARGECAEAGLEIAVEAGNRFLAVIALPTEEPAATHVRVRVIDAILAIGEKLAGRAGADPRVRAAATLHAAAVITLVVDGRLQFVGGDLLCLGDWTGGEAGEGVTATATALQGIEDRYQLGPAPADPRGARRIVAPATP